MKKLVGFLFCIGFLLLAGTFEAQSSEVKPIYTYSVNVGKSDIYQVQDVIGYDYSIPDPGRQEINWSISKDVVVEHFRLMVETPVLRIKPTKDRYVNHYSYQYRNSYNHPPSIKG